MRVQSIGQFNSLFVFKRCMLRMCLIHTELCLGIDSSFKDVLLTRTDRDGLLSPLMSFYFYFLFFFSWCQINLNLGLYVAKII